MIKKLGTFWLAVLLLGLSGMLFLLQHLLFRRPAETGFYFLQDLAFVPISVLLVTLGLNTVLVYRQRQAMLEKISLVVNEFFAETGTDLIRILRPFLVNCDEIQPRLKLGGSWQERDFSNAADFLNRQAIEADARKSDLAALASFLGQQKEQFLHLFENANLMEHDRFTDMLWAVYHVYDELRSRQSLSGLPESDLNHLSGDIRRAARLLLIEWLDSMRLLRSHYPYLYSLAVRKCPFGSGDPKVYD